MARTYSTMIPLGTPASFFTLPDVTTGQNISFGKKDDYNATVLMFICNHCPFVKYINQELTKLAHDYQPKNIRFIAINSNNIEDYPDDSPENMKIIAQEQNYPFAYLFDETQTVAKLYQAACTPDFFVFDKEKKLAYRGQLDDARPGNDLPITGSSIREALDCLLSGKEVPQEQKPSIGCNIKWKQAYAIA